jgi:hypothetical protein
MSASHSFKTGLAFATIALFIAGCTQQQSESTPTQPATTDAAPVDTMVPSTTVVSASTTDDSSEHGHKAGDHGGIMVSLGRDSYHVEAVFEKGNVLRLYMLGNDESRVIDVETQTLKGFVRLAGDSASQPFTLSPEPQEGDKPKRTSQFVGTLPEGMTGQELEVTIPNIAISGERFRLGFQSASKSHNEGMPAKVADEEERQLYLVPGGKYTEADILANGNTTASIKFEGMMSSHDMSPKPGDKICPVTMTKANPQFTWIVGGKPYEFCCPPCVDEFVKMAKTSPDDVLPPGDYVKKPE